MRIMIADDHPLFVEALINLLSDDFEIVSVAVNGQDAIEKARICRPDVLLMDLSMPLLDGIAATKQITMELQETKVIILTSFEDQDTLFRAIRAGAAGYLLKNLDGADIIRGLLELREGKVPFAPGLEMHILQEFRSVHRENAADVEELLNERQLEVLEMVAQGLVYYEVGKKLFISERTVKYHMEKIKEKLGLHSQEQIIAWAWENGIGRPNER